MSMPDLSHLSPEQQQQVIQQVQAQAANAASQEVIQITSKKCFAKCVSSPGGTLSNKEQTCLAMCFDRYLDTIRVVEQTMISRNQ